MAIAYSYSKLLEIKEITALLFSLAAFLILSPQQIIVGDESVGGFLSSNLGSSGLFVSMLIGIIIPWTYSKLVKNKRPVLKMPDTVPPMVTMSFEPIFIGIILLFFVFIVRLGFSFTSFGTIFSFINEIVAKPLLDIGASVPSLFLIYVLANVLFFFGIHPNAIMSVITPVIMTMMMMSIEQFNANG